MFGSVLSNVWVDIELGRYKRSKLLRFKKKTREYLHMSFFFTTFAAAKVLDDESSIYDRTAGRRI